MDKASSDQDTSNLVILGAGRPINGDQHTALRGISDNSRVLDWVLQAVDSLQPSVTFVGGYQIEEISRRYTSFHYVHNTEWESTGAVVSFLEAGLLASREYYVSYADILYRDHVIVEMTESSADIVVAVDSEWKKRFNGRTKQDLLRCEKVCCHENRVTRLGNDIDPLLADSEFVGLTRFKPQVIEFLEQEKPLLIEMFRTDKLTSLIEYLRTKGFEVEAIDVAGNWAELNEPQDLAHFVIGTKAQTLSRLQQLVRFSQIEDQVSFCVTEWQSNKELVLKKISDSFQNCLLVVRSSALSEDGFSSTNAGVFTSILDVNCNDLIKVQDAVEQVIKSYSDNNPVNQVLVQPMVDDVILSGVAFTRTLTQGAPYYVVNYDDESSSTESITSGVAQSNKTLIVHRHAEFDAPEIPEGVRDLFPAMREIENLLNYESLDIEFAISGKGQIHILQVRPIAVKHVDYSGLQQDLETIIKSAESNFTLLQKPGSFVVGSKAFFGVMPDWNPAEIIGTNPKLLATSLYRYLILNDSWATQRAEYGYRDVRPQRLLTEFCGRPYVDIRASFNSFIPVRIDDGLAQKLVDFYLQWLKDNPHLHDKVEFEVIPTCIDLDFDRWTNRFLENGAFTNKEIDTLKTELIRTTRKGIERVKLDLDAISYLESRFYSINKQETSVIGKAICLLDDVKRIGALAFSHLARNGFVAITLLRSAVRAQIIDQGAMQALLRSIHTITHEFTDDAESTKNNKLSWLEFVKKYGHLRPGTYDITSQSYADDPDRFLRPIVEQSKSKLDDNQDIIDIEIWNKQKEKFAKACNEIGLPGDVEYFEKFIREAIEGREFAKFIFTRNISKALDLLAEFGDQHNLTREDLAHIPINNLISLGTGLLTKADSCTWLKKLSEEGRQQHQLASLVELPPIIFKRSDFRVFMYPDSQANYIGAGRTTAQLLNLDVKNTHDLVLKDKIILIPQADPGYDWLFGQQISGLITMYGGANSHMAIRAAEFGLPAAIGVGSVEYFRLSRASVVELDAGNKRIQVVQ